MIVQGTSFAAAEPFASFSRFFEFLAGSRIVAEAAQQKKRKKERMKQKVGNKPSNAFSQFFLDATPSFANLQSMLPWAL